MLKVKYTLTAECPANEDSPGYHIEHVIHGEQTWDELLIHVDHWLKGIGFVYKGEITIVDDKGEVASD